MTRSITKRTTLAAAAAIAGAAMAVTPSVYSYQLWTTNSAKQAIVKGETIVAKRIDSADPANYCAIASTPGTHFTWVDTTGSVLDYAQAWALWAASCSTAVAKMRGAEVYYRDRVDPYSGAIPDESALAPQEIQRATDGGAVVLMVPIDTAAQAASAVDRAYYPPVGSRSVGPGQAASIYADVTADYRATYNDNVVLIAIVSTVDGASNAKEIARVPGIHALFMDRMELESSSGFQEGSKDYERLAQEIRVGAQAGQKHLCTADRGTSPHTLTCVRHPTGKK